MSRSFIIAVFLAMMPVLAFGQEPKPTVVVDQFFELCSDGGDYDELVTKAEALGWASAAAEHQSLFYSSIFKKPTRTLKLSKQVVEGFSVFAMILEEEGRSVSGQRLKTLCKIRLAVEDPFPSRKDLHHRLGSAPDKVVDQAKYHADTWVSFLAGSVVGLQIHKVSDEVSLVTVFQFTGDA